MMDEELRHGAEFLAHLPQAHRQRRKFLTVPRHRNDALARVPKLHRVLNCPVVRGAVASIAGPDYCLHPHRAVHSSAPIDAGVLPDAEERSTAWENAPRMGEGSRANSAWHQDAHSPLARARHHLPRYLIGHYFPRDTPVAMGSFVQLDPTLIGRFEVRVLRRGMDKRHCHSTLATIVATRPA